VTSIKVLVSRLLDLIFSARRERRLDEEIRSHLAMLAEEHIAAGMTPDEAARAARRAFGGVEQVKEAYRDQRGLPLIDRLTQDTRFALRLMQRNRSFALSAVLVLGAGIGVNNMLFTILNAHTLRGLPIPESDRVLWLSTLDDRGASRGLSFLDYQDLAAAAARIERLAAFESAPMVVSGDGGPAERLDGAYVTANAFGVIAATPLLGRGLTAGDGRPGAAGVAVMSRTTWQNRYAADRSAIGRTVTVNGMPVTLVGVMPDRSGFPDTAQVWMPLSQLPGITARPRDARTLQVFGRVADGATTVEAVAEAAGIGERLAQAHLETNGKTRIEAVPINNRFFGDPRHPVWRGFMTVGFLVVFIACANVANLMLDRSTLRARELAIRASLGGSRRRLFRQLLLEGCVLAVAGAGVGLLVAMAAIRVFRTAIPADALPYWVDYTIDWRVLGALVGVSALTVLVFALLPAIQASKSDVIAVLKDGGRAATARRRRGWGTAFLAAQVALSVVLLAQLAVAVRSDRGDLPSVDALDTPDIVTAAMTLPAATYPTPAARLAFYEALLSRTTALAGVEASAITSTLPYSGGESRSVLVDGTPPQPREQPARTALAISITPGYFRVLGLPLLQGRTFEDGDGMAGRQSVIVNEAFAQTFLAGEPALGRRIAVERPEARDRSTPAWSTIVGVAPSIRQHRGTDSEPVVFVPFAAGAPVGSAVLVRSRSDMSVVVTALRQQVQALDSALPIFRARTLPQVRHDAEWNGRLSNRLFLFLTLIAVVLATVGLCAVTAHAVSQERVDIGIRMALGARPRRIIRRIVQRLLVQTAWGFAAGVALTRIWASEFSSGDAAIRPTDPMSLALVGVMLAVLVSVAAIVPSRRASKIQPLEVLRG
jgi:putative ABC transport system permease protein